MLCPFCNHELSRVRNNAYSQSALYCLVCNRFQIRYTTRFDYHYKIKLEKYYLIHRKFSYLDTTNNIRLYDYNNQCITDLSNFEQQLAKINNYSELTTKIDTILLLK